MYFAHTVGSFLTIRALENEFVDPKCGNFRAARCSTLRGVCVKGRTASLHRKTAETVAQDTGATVVDVAQFPGGVKGTEGGYIELVDYLVNSIAKAFEQQKT